MLYAAHWLSLEIGDPTWEQTHLKDLAAEPYRKTHVNHPTTRWVRRSENNYKYACSIGRALCAEYTRRYKKVHATQKRLEWLESHMPASYDQTPENKAFLARLGIPAGCTPIPLAMPEKYHQDHAIAAYRAYYLGEKLHVASAAEKAPKFEPLRRASFKLPN